MKKTITRKFRQPDGEVVERDAVFVTPAQLEKQTPEEILAKHAQEQETTDTQESEELDDSDD